MKNTPNVSANGSVSNANGHNNGPKVIPVSELIEKAKQENPEAKEPTTYPKTATSAPETPQAEPAHEPAPETVPPVNTITALIPVRSRAEEINYQVEKSRKMQLINTQLVSLTDKQAELKQFSYEVNKDDDYRYGRIAIYDDKNREFICKNHGVASLIVDHLLKIFGEKIEEKETELLTVARS